MCVKGGKIFMKGKYEPFSEIEHKQDDWAEDPIANGQLPFDFFILIRAIGEWVVKVPCCEVSAATCNQGIIYIDPSMTYNGFDSNKILDSS